MKSKALMLLAGLLVASLLGVVVLLRQDPRRPNFELLPAEMVRGPAAATMALHAGFPDGLVQRLPPEGTIPRGVSPFPFGPGEAEATRAGEALANPFEATPEVLARAEHVFRTHCAHCHGAGGQGDAPVTRFRFPPPPAFQRAESRALADGEIFHAVTFGRKNMPALAAQVAPEDRWRVIHHVRTLQQEPAPGAAAGEGTEGDGVGGDPSRGDGAPVEDPAKEPR